jgi:hypothetical protein
VLKVLLGEFKAATMAKETEGNAADRFVSLTG